MTPTETVAIAAHLHVLLRRKTGRVTDVEWMASNAEYAAEVVRYARARAVEDGHTELLGWADKLEQAMLARAQPLRPAVPTALSAVAVATGLAPPTSGAASPPPGDSAESRYVGRLR